MWRERQPVEPVTGEQRVLAFADEIRACRAALHPAVLYDECVQAFRRGEIDFDAVTVLYKHAMIHAGAVIPRDRERFERCPVCKVALWGDGGGEG